MSLGSVLVLDENRIQAQRISSMLHQHKWTSVLSFDPRMAMRILKSGRFHLLLFDAYAQGSSTLQIVEEIRQEAQDAPLAIMSDGGNRSAALNSTMNAARVAGADFVIPKPFSPEKLKNLLADTNSYHRARSKEHHILVVEDDPDLRRAVVGVLTQVGYKVSYASNMEDVFFDHNLGLVDVVLTAVLIPGIGGIEGTAQIKNDFPHVKVVAMSEGVDATITAVHVLAAAKAAGADALLAKPFHMPELLRTITSIIRAKDAPPEDNAAQAAVDAFFD
ncbi:response regulator [Asticcacaulis sp. EMRT-3]|uniref:response regulator n=1 Tax=Asticcacaulis sp. EMRT-3 TaxID=3040349 RepID=UPI0024AFE972|nr:response regulator [Asticcacaulis sp. EMRT-3]MDI7774622.1 response regulator [Asticcacaulis sp. EMRT-3]